MADEVNDCSCTGTRSCLLCEKNNSCAKGKNILNSERHANDISRHFLCLDCYGVVEFGEECSHNVTEQSNKLITGITVIQDFISEEEERLIVREIDQTCWKASQSGRRKQVWTKFILTTGSPIFLSSY